MSDKPELCDACGTDMCHEGATFIAMVFEIRDTTEGPKHREHQRLEKYLGKSKMQVCYVCLAKALGIKAKT